MVPGNGHREAVQVVLISKKRISHERDKRTLSAASVIANSRKSTRGELLGDRLRDLRKAKGWTLANVSGKTGLAVSTLSKVENNKISLTYDNLVRLAIGLELDLVEFFTPTAFASVSERFSVSRSGTGKVHDTPNYAHQYLCVDLAGRRMIPMLSRIKARSIAEFGELISHPREEFLSSSKGLKMSTPKVTIPSGLERATVFILIRG
jgi:transcriptional regulator with XRE-family HTH domain